MAKIENFKFDIQEAFRDCFYVVPDYQREYVWTEKERERMDPFAAAVLSNRYSLAADHNLAADRNNPAVVADHSSPVAVADRNSLVAAADHNSPAVAAGHNNLAEAVAVRSKRAAAVAEEVVVPD